MKDPCQSRFFSCSLWKALTEAQGKCEEEGAAERNCYVLTITHHPHTPYAAQSG